MSTTVTINNNTYQFQEDFFGDTGYEYLTSFPAIVQDVVVVAGQVEANADRAEAAVAAVDLQQGFKNFIHNGGMRIDQISEGAALSVSANNVKSCLDRYTVWVNNDEAAISVQRVTDAPVGLSHSLKATVTTPATSALASGDNIQIYQSIEGLDWGSMNFGTANAKAWSCSFWVKASITGQYSAVLQNGNTGNRSFIMPFTINVANTWELKTFNNNIGDVTGTWANDNSASAKLMFFTSSHTGNLNASSLSWLSGAYYGSTGHITNWITTNGATFQVSGVQVNEGTAAATFQNRPIAEEFRICQRYLFKTFPAGTAPAQNAGVAGSLGIYSHVASAIFGGTIFFPVAMRATPTMTHYNPSAANANWRDVTNSADRTRTTGTVSDKGYDLSGASGAAAALNRIHCLADAGL